jgi:hypothetical protein
LSVLLLLLSSAGMASIANIAAGIATHLCHRRPVHCRLRLLPQQPLFLPLRQLLCGHLPVLGTCLYWTLHCRGDIHVYAAARFHRSLAALHREGAAPVTAQADLPDRGQARAGSRE